MINREEETITHDSFGQIAFSRVQSNGSIFYGSELPQDHYIKLEISSSEINRTLTQDWFFAKKSLVRLRLSSNQFSEMITSMNRGSGVPCTLEYINEKKVAELPKQESRKDFVHRKFEDRMKLFSDSIRKRQNEAKDLVKKKSLSKQDMQSLQHHLDWLTNEVDSNIPFFAKCFQETMDEVVVEAKTEVENAIQHKINTLGLAELHNQQKLL